MKFYLLLPAILLFFTINVDAQQQWEAPAAADTLENPYSLEDGEIIKKGENLYLDWCSSCHGLEGDGDGPAGQSFDPPPADFTGSQVQQQSDGALFWKIKTGKPPFMLSFEKMLSEEEMWQLVTYLRTFGKKD